MNRADPEQTTRERGYEQRQGPHIAKAQRLGFHAITAMPYRHRTPATAFSR
jgi:hypothetical protein